MRFHVNKHGDHDIIGPFFAMGLHPGILNIFAPEKWMGLEDFEVVKLRGVRVTGLWRGQHERTLPKTNSSPQKMMFSNNLLFQRLIFRCKMLVSGRVPSTASQGGPGCRISACSVGANSMWMVFTFKNLKSGQLSVHLTPGTPSNVSVSWW